jgi:hypothetical protein
VHGCGWATLIEACGGHFGKSQHYPMACLGQSLSSLGHRPQGVQRTGSAGRASGACSQSISAVQTTIKRRNHKHHSSLAAKAVSGQPDQPPMARTLDGPGFDAQVLAILQNSQGLTVAGLQAAMASSNKWVLPSVGFCATWHLLMHLPCLMPVL